METRQHLLFSRVLGRSFVCVLLLLAVPLCSVKCMLMPCSDSLVSGCGSGDMDDNSSFEMESTMTIEASPTSTRSLTGSFTKQSSSSVLLSSSVLMTTSVDITSTRNMEIQSSTAIPTSMISTTSASSFVTDITSVSELIKPTQVILTVTPTREISTVAPTLTPGSATPTLTPGSATPTLTPGSVTPTLTPGSATPTLTPGSATPTLTPGSATPTLTPGSATPMLTPGLVTPTLTPGSATPTLTPGSARTTTMTPSIPLTTNQIATTNEQPAPPTQSILDLIREFFDELVPEARIGFGVGGGVVLLLLIIILCFCCCCVCSQLKKKRRGRMDINNHRPSLTISNPSALISSSREHDEKPRARYRSTLHDSLDYSADAINLKDLDSELLNFPSNEFRESAIDDGERAYMTGPSQMTHAATQPSQMTQMSTATDLFREHSLPRLSPLSYSSQILTAPQFPTHRPSLSVDESDPYMGGRRQSLLTVIPNPSPSLNQPTLMARSLKNEETKSAHGSKASVQGSRTSIQGSRPSMLGSRGSVHTGTGSRSQIYSSNLSSREHSVLLLNGAREFGVSEEDAVSLQLSGRGISPALKQNSFEEVPTRDSPAPEMASHAVGYGKKDFASLTCIPNQYAVEAERLEEKSQLSTVPEKQTIDETKEKEVTEETKKKPRSRAMSKLEKLTSLDYIRASLRLKKKKVSFVKTPESAKKERQKNDKGKPSPEEKVKDHEQASAEHASHPGKEILQNRRHSATARTEFSPQHAHAGEHKYPEHYYYPQLSQPLYYGGGGGGATAAGGAGVHPVAAAAAMFYQYPQLSQQYYAQLSQGGYGPGPAYPPHMLYHGNMMDPYSRNYGEPSTGSRYQAIVTPDLFDDDTPEPEFYHERSPDNVLQQRQQPNGFGDSFRSPEHSNLRPSSPDRFTETSDTSSYAVPPTPGSASHTHEDSITSAHNHFMDEFVMDGAEHYGYGAGVGEQHYGHSHPVPTYPMDMLNRTGHIPHEAYRDVYQQHGDMGQDYDTNTHGHTNGHSYYSHYTSPTAVSLGKGGGRRPSRSSYASSSSDHTHLEAVQEGEGERPPTKSEDMNGSSTKNRVSWSTEVIEYQRTPSDMGDSDFDFNHF